MDYSYYDNDKQLRKFQVTIGLKWTDNNANSDVLNSIFKLIDNGDGIIQEKEFSIMQYILKSADSTIRETADNGIVDEKEFLEIAKDFNSDYLKELKAGKIDKIDPNDYTIENLKKRYPEDKYIITNNSYSTPFNYENIVIRDKSDNRIVLSVVIGEEKNGKKFFDITENSSTENYVYRSYSDDGSIIIYQKNGEGVQFPFATDFRKLLYGDDGSSLIQTAKLFEKINQLLEKINPQNIAQVLCSVYTSTNKTQTLDDLIEKSPLLKNYPDFKKRIYTHLTKCLEIARGYEANYRIENSQIKNKFHTGDSYTIDCKNDIMTIKNQKTGKKRTIDLNKLVEDLPIERQIDLKSYLATLPGEFLMDLAVETDSFRNYLKIKKESDDMGNTAAYYHPWSDNITLGVAGYHNENCWTVDIVHELGHAIDNITTKSLVKEYFNKSPDGYNYSSYYMSEENEEFIAAFNLGLKRFTDANYARCGENGAPTALYKKEDESGNLVAYSNYATKNHLEMFAECYDT